MPTLSKAKRCPSGKAGLRLAALAVALLSCSISSLAANSADSLYTQIFADKKLRVKSLAVDSAQQAWLGEAGINLKRYVGKPADQTLMHGVLQKFITYNENNGYPFAHARFDDVQMDSLFFSATLKLEKGKYTSIDTLIVKGDGRVRYRFMQNHLGLRRPRPYSEKYVQSVDRRIAELGFLHTLQPSALEFTPQSTALYTYVDNAKANRANGLLAFGNNDQGEFSVQGEASIFLANMFKGGEQLSIDWSSPGKNTQLLNVGLRLPYLILGTVGVNALFDMERRDTLYLSLHGKLGLSSRVGSYSSASLFVDFQRHNNTTQNTTATGTLYGVDYALSATDNPLFPRRGCSVFTSLAAGTRKVDDDGRSTATELAADVAWHRSLTARLGVMLRAQGKFKGAFADGKQEKLYQSELYSIGGANSLRGFNERSIFTPAYAIATIEPRFYFSGQGYFAAFCDYAPVKNESETGKSYDQFLSLGLGTRFATGVGIFSLSYALGKENSSNFLFKNAKVHVGYMVVF